MARINTGLNGSWWRCRNKYIPSNRTASQSSKTTQPCQAVGGPQPHPYLFAGNQYDLPLGTASLRRRSNGEVEGPPRSARQAPRAHTVSPRPRRVATHRRSRTPPTIVSWHGGQPSSEQHRARDSEAGCRPYKPPCLHSEEHRIEPASNETNGHAA